MPQCAVIGWPIHTGQVSPAALSQTVKIKSNCGASGAANSSQLFERMPAMSKPSPFRTDRAIGWTAPLGWLPALQARKRPSPSLFMMARSEEHTSELQSLMRISYAVFCLKKKKHIQTQRNQSYYEVRHRK